MTLQYAAKDQQFINLRDPVAGRAADADSLKAALRTLGGGVSVIT
ncbi:flavin reductase, partial [Rhizobium sp. BR5]